MSENTNNQMSFRPLLFRTITTRTLTKKQRNNRQKITALENERKKFDKLEFIKAGNKQCQSTQIFRSHSARCFSSRSLQGPEQ